MSTENFKFQELVLNFYMDAVRHFINLIWMRKNYLKLYLIVYFLLLIEIHCLDGELMFIFLLLMSLLLEL